jgi:hypothetical protein
MTLDHQHSQSLNYQRLSEGGSLKRWRKTGINLNQLGSWVDKDLRKGWGFKAAAWTFHIARFGFDADVVGQYKGNTPTTIPMQATRSVPGATRNRHNLYDLSQILAWLAKERRDV